MSEEKPSFSFKIIRGLVKLFYPKIEVLGLENIPDEPCIFVGNHSQMHGPIACELYFPVKSYTWCAGEMMELKEVPAYAYKDFWSGKPKYIRWFYRLLSYIIAPLSVCMFNNANTVGVYHDIRLRNTFNESMAKLDSGACMVIFPEHSAPYNHILCDFQQNFVDVARMYHKRCGRELEFVPMYLAPKLRKLYFGKPVHFDAAAPIKEERKRICARLKEEITSIAVSLPEHTVVPYNNISKKLYPKNTCSEEKRDEKAPC